MYLRIIFFIFSIIPGILTKAQVTLTNTGTLKISGAADTLFVNGNFTNTAPASLANDGKIYVKGDLTNNQVPALTGNGIIFLTGNANQNLGGTCPFKNLTLNKTAGTASLTSNVSVNGALEFISGRIKTGVNTVILPAGAALTGASQNTGWVNGKLQKNVATGPITKNYEVGDSLKYAPVSIVFPNVTTAGNITVQTITGDHPNLNISVFNGNKSVNRYWRITNGGAAFNNYNATFNFATSDLDSFTNTALFTAGLYNGTSWYMPGTSVRNPNNTNKAAFSTFGDYAIGETFSVVPVIYIAVNAVKEKDGVKIEWRVTELPGIHHYEVERFNGIAFIKINELIATGSGYYYITDADPLTGDNLYRIRTVAASGTEKLSQVVQVNISHNPAVGIYPNPVAGNEANLQLTNLSRQTCRYKIFNSSGQSVLSGSFQHPGGNGTQTFLLGHLPAGTYKCIVYTQLKVFSTIMIKL